MVSIHLLEKENNRRKIVSAKPRQLGSNCTPLIVWFQPRRRPILADITSMVAMIWAIASSR
jgi:hypothetical protein